MNEKKKKSSSTVDSKSRSALKSRFQIAEGYSKAGLLLMKYAGRANDSTVLHSLMVLKGSMGRARPACCRLNFRLEQTSCWIARVWFLM